MSAKILPPGTPIPSDALYEVIDGQIVIEDDEMPGNGVPGDILYEVIDGQIVELPPMGAFEVDIASILFGYLIQHAHAHKFGRVVSEMLFQLDAAKPRKRRPDLAFVSYGRWPRRKKVPSMEAWQVVPELPIEVVGPSNTAEEVLVKVGEYFQAGGKRVWVVYPNVQQVYVYQSPSLNTILTRDDALDGEDILPGFRLPLADLFETYDD